MEKIGITTTVPVEAIFAAGMVPVDLNNLFISSDDYGLYIDEAERAGFPKSMCAWIKGIYGAALHHGIKSVVGVVGGDCSNTVSLSSILESEGLSIIPFAYPHSRNYDELKLSISNFAEALGTTLEASEAQREILRPVRKLAAEYDCVCWEQGGVSGFDNHLMQVSLSDFFGGSPEQSQFKLEQALTDARNLQKSDNSKEIRVGYIGVPPMIGDLYSAIEKFGGRVIYNEVQREFAFPREADAADITEQYLDYTYPYTIDFRLQEISKQIKLRKIDVLIHYTQAFCHRALDDIVIKRSLDIPVLTIEGDRSNSIDARTMLRLEAFLDMAADLKHGVGM